MSELPRPAIPTSAKLFRRLIFDTVRSTSAQEPACLHAPPGGFCGGCSLQERSYSDQVSAKRHALRTIWRDTLPAERLEHLDLIASPQPLAYRTRMDYVASKGRFGLRRGGKFNYIVDLDRCLLLPEHGFAAARALYDRAMELGLPDYNLRSHEGFLRYVVVRRSPDDQLLVAMVTAADTQGSYATAMAQLADLALTLPDVIGFHWLVNATLTDVSFGATERIWGAATLPMRVGERILQIEPNTFFQNNIALLLPLLDDVAGRVGSSTRVADLYGGVGTIALHLADQVGQVVCVESVAESAVLAERNVVANNVSNVAVVAADVLAFLREQPAGRFDTVVVDPPRIGLGPEVCAELLRLRPQRIVYVSCNPLTQIDDARLLAAGYTMPELRGYDMFPQTPHLESLALFMAL
ncbi:MAG TPA: 23S rRNA (uracil(1939)-C(5))-methyltransferase RlmD [Roseiflexaceae bacterium]|nr:23S rRNA (uracil(1939)-C(5))-methyltransferase RlmD [Roseiflexaceae bacterium]